ncbi:RHS repeat-associated core domain-containing protein [Erythrobacter sp. THAF29]|uniref:RHS repeat-associated core domain-containing protein n=1 Tax=Erythrobacter sp. THAF29 TaxID=2587851 RepID=UPI001267DB18|nr:RHS repeat-associated core domain-containing protein [Erythrobacter sp. THAF29]QFT78732.1 tRNA(Glu)-specific nuclease WapA precursor [Erythrobacter sp. THAF29]
MTPANSVLYGYDEVGRLTLAVSDGASTSAETYTYTAGTNRLDTFTDASGTRSIAYDGRGNTVSETRPGGIVVTATYDGHGRLATYDRTSIGAQTYTYNGLGDRVRVDKPTGTRHFVYDAYGRVIAEYGSSASDVKAEFIWAIPPAANDNSPFGGGDHIAGYGPLALVAENASNQFELYWVHGNHLGVPIVTTNAQGSVVTPSNDFLRPGFPGQSQVLSDLYYNRARDYDPVTGRYIQADPIGLAGDVNPYVYAAADPVNLIDPRGEAAFVPFMVGAGIAVAIEYFTNDCADIYDLAMAGALGAIGGGTGFRILYRFGPRSLSRVTGKEWSHSVPKSAVNKFTSGRLRNALNRRGGLNGSWASPRRHYKHDPKRWPIGYRQMGRRLPGSLQKLDRIPDWLKVSTATGAAAAAVTGED